MAKIGTLVSFELHKVTGQALFLKENLVLFSVGSKVYDDKGGIVHGAPSVEALAPAIARKVQKFNRPTYHQANTIKGTITKAGYPEPKRKVSARRRHSSPADLALRDIFTENDVEGHGRNQIIRGGFHVGDENKILKARWDKRGKEFVPERIGIRWRGKDGVLANRLNEQYRDRVRHYTEQQSAEEDNE